MDDDVIGALRLAGGSDGCVVDLLYCHGARAVLFHAVPAAIGFSTVPVAEELDNWSVGAKPAPTLPFADLAGPVGALPCPIARRLPPTCKLALE